MNRPATSSWQPVDLAVIVAGIQAGSIMGPVPSLLKRTDGVALIYPGESHSIAGEPETGKGFIAGSAAAEVLAGDGRVLYLDFEDAPVSMVGRMLALGASAEEIIDRFVYVNPEDTLTPGALDALLAAGPYVLAILDGVNEAYALLGLDYSSNQDIPTFRRRLARPITDTGAALVEVDHVAKNRETRGRFAIGGQQKLAGVAVAYGVEVIDRPSRQHTGRVKLLLAKDRHGHIPGQVGATVAIATIAPEDDGARVTVTLDPPDSTGVGETFRPTTLMERVSLAVEEHPGLTKRAIRTTVRGKAEWVDAALELLIAEGFIRVEAHGQARHHHVERPFRADEDDDRVPVSRPCPDRVPDTGGDDRGPVSPPTGDTDTVHATTNGRQPLDTLTADRDPDGELERLSTKFPDLTEPSADQGVLATPDAP